MRGDGGLIVLGQALSLRKNYGKETTVEFTVKTDDGTWFEWYAS